jgi:cytochrome c oxidase cbb3-type subunit III
VKEEISFLWLSIRIRVAITTILALAPGALGQKARVAPGVAGRGSGKRSFITRCAGCHGLDGRGGERAPDIATNPKIKRMSDGQLTQVISKGIPDVGMPAFRLMGVSEIKRVVAYLRVLQGSRLSANLAGDAQNGKAIFFGKGECAKCHRISDQGGFLGPDLSKYGQSLMASDIRHAITDPKPSGSGVKTATATTTNGQMITGIVRNEDNFSVQLQSADGRFHFLSKSELQALQYETGPRMPKDYGEKLSPKELDDVVKYLHSAATESRLDRQIGEEE